MFSLLREELLLVNHIETEFPFKNLLFMSACELFYLLKLSTQIAHLSKQETTFLFSIFELLTQ